MEKFNTITTKILNKKTKMLLLDDNSTQNEIITSQIQDTNIMTKTSSSNNNKKHIYIFGDQQAYGLNKIISKTRFNEWNDNYKIISFIKPNATSTQIISSCNRDFLKTLHADDIVVFVIGSNDKRPYVLLSEICNVLYSLRGYTVFVTNVQYNPYLNENMINEKLELIINNYKYCKYLKIQQDSNYSYLNDVRPIYNHKYYLQRLCHRLNIEIDYKRYHNEFINKIRCKVTDSNNQTLQPYTHITKINTRTRTTQTKLTSYFTKKGNKTSLNTICFR